jgi:uncharacterized protein YjiS (DUF1127 family)
MADVMTELAPCHRGLVREDGGPLRRAWRQLRQRRSERIAAFRLNAMDDHLLRDIGVTRDGILDRVRHGR